MIARSAGTRVLLEFSPSDPENYLQPINEFIEAWEDYNRNTGDLSTWELRPFRDRISAAEVDLESVFSEVVSIESAEFVLRTLNRAITEAKVARGDFAKGDDE